MNVQTQPPLEAEPAEIDFAAAGMFLEQAKVAHDKGDKVGCFAARKLVAVALGLTDGPLLRIHTAHLK